MNLMRLSALAGALALLMLASPPCRAEPDQMPPPVAAPAAPPGGTAGRQALVNLARQFVDKVNKDFAAADQFIDQIQPEDVRAQKYFDNIPDGETLLLEIRLGKLMIERPVAAIKQGHDVMISLADFIAAADFAIKVDSITGKADGWFIRESQPFHLDLKAGKVMANKKTFDITAGDIQVQDNDIMVKGQVLARWFNFYLVTNLARQGLDVASPQKWPYEEKVDRIKLSQHKEYILPPPALPLQDDPYKQVTIPNIDVSLTQTYNRAPAGPDSPPITKQTHYTMQAAGDFAGETNEIVASGTNQDKIDSVRETSGKTSDDPVLLGPLKARQYQFGDVDVVNVPYATTGAGEAGVHVTNKNPFSTYDTTTNITGDATPGWDVELYRNDSYIGLVTAGSDGRYLFKDVDLFAGENIFRIVQYGPQGEQKESTKTINVSPTLSGVRGGAYDVSVSAEDTQTYLKGQKEDANPDRGKPHLAATYEQQVADHVSLQGGVQILQQQGRERAYVEDGTIVTAGKTILNANTVIDNDGGWTAIGEVRRSFGDQSLLGSLQYSSQNFDPSNGGQTPSNLTLRGVARGPIPVNFGTRPTYQYESDITQGGGGVDTIQNKLDLSTKLGQLFFSNSLTDTIEHGAPATSSTTVPVAIPVPGSSVPAPAASGNGETTKGTFTVRGTALGVLWRTAASYELRPLQELTEYAINLNKNINPKLAAEAGLKYDPTNHYTIGDMSLDWLGDHATISPTVSYDSLGAFSALMQVRFGLSRNPYTGAATMSGRTESDKGGISALVYLDKDGDNRFSPGDELLEGVTVEAIHSRLEAETDKNGEAFIYNLPTNTITDVVVQESSGMDPSWVSGFAGISVRPRPGYITRVEFPMHISGEVDGTVYANMAVGKPRILKDIHLMLYDGDGKVVMSTVTGYDGYYLFERIPPGLYYLMADEDDTKNNHVSRPAPQKIDIGYKGTIIDGNNIFMDPAGVDVPVFIKADLGDYARMNPTLDVAALRNKTVILNLGSYFSRELMVVVWYKLKTRYGVIIGPGHLLVQPADSYASPQTGLNTLRVSLPGYDVRDAWQRCRALISRGLYCEVEILPKGLQQLSAVESPPRT
jgi:hypothetical protein